MKRLLSIAVVSVGILSAGASQAGGVSIGVSLGGFGIGLGHCGVMVAVPIVVPPPMVYAQPVYVSPPPPVIVAAPAAYYVQPCPVCAPTYYPVNYVASAPVVVMRRGEYRRDQWGRYWRR